MAKEKHPSDSSDSNYFRQSLREIRDDAASDAKTGIQLTITGLVLLGVIVGIGTGWYYWYRNVGSNQERDMALNSGRREFTELVNLTNILTQCETQKVKIAALQAERDAFDPESQPAAYKMANDNLLGTQTFYAECAGKINGILSTTELENVPEYQNGLKQRVEALLAE